MAKFREIVDAGETNPYRAINLFQSWEHSQVRQYDPETGSLSYTKQDFAHAETLFPTGKPILSSTFLGGQLIKLPYYTKKQIGRFILDYLEHEDLLVDAIAELGAGWGRYLFDLYFAGCPSDIALLSGEVAPDARHVTEMLCGLDPAIPLTVHDFDFYRPNLDFLKGRESVLFFTHMAVMFIPELPRQAILEMAGSAKRVRCIHFEPCGFQISAVDYPVSRIQESEALPKAWNIDLVPILEALHNEGLIELEYLAKDVMMGGGLSHPLTIAIWHKR